MIPFALFTAFFCEYLRPPNPSVWLQAWYKQLLDWAVATFDANQTVHGWAVWIVAVGFPSIATACVYWLLLVLATPLAWAFSVLVLYSTIAFRPFVTYIQSLHVNNPDENVLGVNKALPTLPQDALLTGTSNPLDAAVQYVHQHVLGLTMAYILLAICGFGPAGAVLYYGAALAVRHARIRLNVEPAQSAHTALTAWGVINWLPARIVAISFAAVGNFEQALHNWRALHATKQHNAHYCTRLLQTVVRGAIETTTIAEAPAAKLSTPTASETTPPQSSTYDPTWFEDSTPTILPSFQPSNSTSASDAVDAQRYKLDLLAKLLWRTMLLWGVCIGFISMTHWVS